MAGIKTSRGFLVYRPRWPWVRPFCGAEPRPESTAPEIGAHREHTTEGTRTGDLDPGVLFYPLREKAMFTEAIAAMIDHGSGMMGISGRTGDMRQLRDAGATDADANLAIRMFERSVCQQVAVMATSLGGVDMLVMTGGIGENDAATAQAIQHGLAWLPALRIRTIASQEDQQIALHSARLQSAGP